MQPHMNSKFKVKVNNLHELEISKTDISEMNLIKISEEKYHILDNEKSIIAEIIACDFNKKKYAVKVNSNTYSVSIANELDQLIESMGFSVGSSKHINLITAPMPGLILDININEGQEVKENDALLILEAMKMENVITSPRDGIIKSISAIKGDAVEKNQLLIEFE